MKLVTRCLVLLLMSVLTAGCDSDHTREFNKIDRYDIAAYQAFINEYPESKHIPDARERIQVAIEYQEQQRLIEEQEQRELEEQLRRERLEQEIYEKYHNNSLSTGAQPYRNIYGSNRALYGYPHSEISVKASSANDVIVIVRNSNQNGAVAGHCYINAGHQHSIQVPNDQSYQVFFYIGNGWNPNKEMKNGVVGGFIQNESFMKDPDPSYLTDMTLQYELTATVDGNFSVAQSDQNEVF